MISMVSFSQIISLMSLEGEAVISIFVLTSIPHASSGVKETVTTSSTSFAVGSNTFVFVDQFPSGMGSVIIKPFRSIGPKVTQTEVSGMMSTASPSKISILTCAESTQHSDGKNIKLTGSPNSVGVNSVTGNPFSSIHPPLNPSIFRSSNSTVPPTQTASLATVGSVQLTSKLNSSVSVCSQPSN